EDGIRDDLVTGVQTCALPISFRRFGILCRTVLAGGVGMVLLSATMTVWALAGWRWGPVLVLASAAVAFALRGLIPKGSDPALSDPRAERRDEGPARTPVLIALVLTAISILAALAATIAARSTSPDLLLFWGPKA